MRGVIGVSVVLGLLLISVSAGTHCQDGASPLSSVF